MQRCVHKAIVQTLADNWHVTRRSLIANFKVFLVIRQRRHGAKILRATERLLNGWLRKISCVSLFFLLIQKKTEPVGMGRKDEMRSVSPLLVTLYSSGSQPFLK